MQNTLIHKLHEYIRENNPDLLIQLDEDGKVTEYLLNKVTTVSTLIKPQDKEIPAYIIEDACMDIDAGGVPHENYKSLLEKTVPCIANKSQKGFSSESLCKYSDKVDPEAKENVKRFLQKMIRNIDSYD